MTAEKLYPTSQPLPTMKNGKTNTVSVNFSAAC
jgi:hypothetical protein